MEQSAVTALFLPLALGIIMLGMGMTLTIDDFRRIVKDPRAVLVGLSAQLVLLPLFGLLLAVGFELRPELAVGLMLLALSPGGATSNLISHLAKADLALSVTLTAISSIVTNFTLPIFLGMALQHWMQGDKAIELPFIETFAQIFVVTILPVSLGMVIKQRFPTFTEKSLKAVNIVSAVFFVLILLLAILKERENIVPYFKEAGIPALVLNLGALLLGYLSGLFFKLDLRQRVAISIETGIQNGTLAIAIALSPVILNNTEIAIPAAIYSLMMFVTAGAVVLWSRQRADMDI
jgi:bile acid:Na+ symporter, BASS family